MENRVIGDDGWYRGRDLMNSQKKLLFQRLTEAIRNEQGELAHLLDWKEKNTEQFREYEKQLNNLRAHQGELEKIQELKNKMTVIDNTQGDILLALQPPYHELFDQIADEVLPGMSYNDELRHDVRFDLIFGERDITGPGEESREHYRVESGMRGREENRQKKLERLLEKRKKEREKIILPKDHRLITKDNYERLGRRIAKYMEISIKYYGEIFTLDTKDTATSPKLIEKYFVYFFIRALIDTKLVFDIKSTKGGKCLDDAIETILAYFENILGQKLEINPMNIKRRLWSNLHSQEIPMDVSYRNALLEDIEYREKYLNETYFKDKGISVDKLRLQIMTEYGLQKGVKEKVFEMMNPLYYIYKDEVEKHKMELNIMKHYQKEKNDQNPVIQQIIDDINKKISYAQEKKKEHTVFEEDPKIKSRYEHSLTEIRNQYMKKYKIPVQYRHIFGVIMNKLNNFYQIKIGLIKKANKINDELTKNLQNSEQSSAYMMYFLNNYITFKDLNGIFNKKRPKKRTERKEEITKYIQDLKKMKWMKEPQVNIQKAGMPRRKKTPAPCKEQLTLDF